MKYKKETKILITLRILSHFSRIIFSTIQHLGDIILLIEESIECIGYEQSRKEAGAMLWLEPLKWQSG
jgi:hypothetical protein